MVEHVATIPSGPVTTITQLPAQEDERLIVSTLNGIVYSVNLSNPAEPTVFLDASDLTVTGVEKGFFSVTFHPDFGESNRYFYVNHSILLPLTIPPIFPRDRTALARYEMSELNDDVVDVSSRTVMYMGLSVSNHNGGDMHFGPDGCLYLATGEAAGGCAPQNPSLVHGKILRFDVDQNIDTPPYYGIPPDNPMAGNPNGLEEFYFLGLRNPWRFSFDRLTGDVWIADVGNLQRDEINHVAYPFSGGLNFGWPLWEGDLKTNATCAPNPPESFDEFVEPVHTIAWSINTAVIGGFVYRGSSIPELYGRYILGDRGSRTVWAMNPTDYSVEEILTGPPLLDIVTFGEDRNGEIYIGSGNLVHRIVPAPPAEITDRLMIQ